MNIYLTVILISLIGTWALNGYARGRNRKALDPRLPEEFADVFDREKYRESQTYTRDGIREQSVRDAVSTACLLGFLLLGGFNVLDLWVRAMGHSEAVTGVLYVCALFLLGEVLGLPFDLYHTFALEARYGFNTTSPSTFALDKLKSYLLAALLGGPLIYAILLFFMHTGSAAWLWCWGLTTAVVLAVQYVAPVWILPLFNTFTPLEDQELRAAIEALARDNGYDISNIFVIDGSRRSTKANAYFTGFGSKKRIALFDTLLNTLGREEILAVLAHEIGHCAKRHLHKRLVAAILQTGALFFLMSLFMGNAKLFAAFGMEHMSVYAGLVFFGILYSPVSLVLSVLANRMSRKHEYEADAFAKKAMHGPAPLVSALKKLSASSLSNLTPDPFYVALNYGHPPVLARIRALNQGR